MAAGSANAADIAAPVYKAPPVAPVYNWSGFYIGGHGGCAASKHNYSTAIADSDGPDPGTFFAFDSDRGGGCFGGGQIGFNWQFPGSAFVWGVEADAAWSNIVNKGSFGEFEVGEAEILSLYESKLKAFGTVRGRIGWATSWWSVPVLPYFAGGFAWGRNTLSVTNIDVATAFSDTQTHTGWTVGGGIEVALGSNWSLKGEYLYIDLGSKTYNVAAFDDGIATRSTPWDMSLKIQSVKIGLNYRFGWDSPVYAKY